MTTNHRQKVSGALDAKGVFSTLNGRPIRWQDGRGLVHICRGSDVHPDVRLLWTLCHRDVPADSAFLAQPGESFEVCATCMKRQNDGA